MATVTGYTAERMNKIENETVISGTVVGDNLVLRRRDGVTMQAGNVRGLKGDQGPVGTIQASPAGGDLGGNYPSPTLSLAGMQKVMPVGTILMFAGENPPAGFLFAHGQALSRTTYATLFGILGTNYGVGDGSTTFNVPDLRGVMPMGRTVAEPRGTKGGSRTKTLEAANLPPHSHTFTVRESVESGGPQNHAASGVGLATIRSVNTSPGPGSAAPFDVTNPFITLTFILKV